jgi:hypothetical protein
VTLGGTGLFGGVNGLGVNTALGNPNVKPERKTETEFGFDTRGFNGRLGFEYTYFNSKITDLFLQRPLANSTGLATEFFNGGTLANKGSEAALTIEPIRGKGISWVSRTSFQRIRNRVEKLPIAPFAVGSTGFGAAYGRSRIAQGVSTTAIWGNKPIYRKTSAGADSIFTRDTIVGESNPDFETFFTNTVTYKRFTFSMQIDWRKGGDLSSMSNNLYDEGQNSRDFDAPSPCRGATLANRNCVVVNGLNRLALVDTSRTATLGAYRYDFWNGGSNSTSYIQDGSFVKLREISLTYAVPTTFTQRRALEPHGPQPAHLDQVLGRRSRSEQLRQQQRRSLRRPGPVPADEEHRLRHRLRVLSHDILICSQAATDLPPRYRHDSPHCRCGTCGRPAHGVQCRRAERPELQRGVHGHHARHRADPEPRLGHPGHGARQHRWVLQRHRCARPRVAELLLD